MSSFLINQNYMYFLISHFARRDLDGKPGVSYCPEDRLFPFLFIIKRQVFLIII